MPVGTPIVAGMRPARAKMAKATAKAPTGSGNKSALPSPPGSAVAAKAADVHPARGAFARAKASTAHPSPSKKTVPELRAEAKSLGLNPHSKARKADLLEMLNSSADRPAAHKMSAAKAGMPKISKPKAEKPNVSASKAPSQGKDSRRTVGRDLVAADRVALAKDVVANQYSQQGADRGLAVIANRQGFDGKPQVVSKAEMDKLVAEGHAEMFRGVVGSYRKSAADMQEDTRSGPAFFGNGMFANGYYFSEDRQVGVDYSDKSPGSVLRGVLIKDANIVSYKEIEAEHEAFLKSIIGRPDAMAMRTTYDDLGRYAAARGYDAIVIPGQNRHPIYDVLNRTATILEEA
jgi:hypothetical protein